MRQTTEYLVVRPPSPATRVVTWVSFMEVNGALFVHFANVFMNDIWAERAIVERKGLPRDLRSKCSLDFKVFLGSAEETTRGSGGEGEKCTRRL